MSDYERRWREETSAAGSRPDPNACAKFEDTHATGAYKRICGNCKIHSDFHADMIAAANEKLKQNGHKYGDAYLARINGTEKKDKVEGLEDWLPSKVEKPTGEVKEKKPKGDVLVFDMGSK